MKIKRFIGGLLESNGYVIYHKEGQSAYIIDPGYKPKVFLDFLEKNNLKLKGILLTHHHYDHVGAVDKIAAETGAKVYIHTDDMDLYKKAAEHLEDGQIIDLDGEKIRVIGTPGHSEGGICLFSEESKLVFTGDTIFNVDIGRTDLEGGDPNKMKDSMINIINKWGNDIHIYPGHGDSCSMKFVRKSNIEFLDAIGEK